MLTTRIYRLPCTLERALEEIVDAAGLQFCPRCVAALERLLPQHRPVAAAGHAIAAS
jgi:HD-GYP domain-containing protein (c-di-GMP phosphodiesterase class II)